MRTVIFGVLAGVMMAACGGDRVTTIAGLTADVDAGADVYTNVCSVCHAADGSGGTGSNLLETMPGLDAEAVITVIIDGQDTMPPQTALDDQEVADVTAYVRANFGAP